MFVLRIAILVPGILILLCGTGCSPGTSRSNDYTLDMTGIMSEQFQVLKKLNPAANKQVNYQGVSEAKTLSDIDWEEELNLVWDFDLQQSKYTGVFAEEARDSLGYRVVAYRQTAALKNYRFDAFRVVYDEKDRVRQIYIDVDQSNFFFDRKNKIVLNFGLYEDRYPLLENYYIRRRTASTWFENTVFEVDATVQIN